jgi:membrane protein DedA with SNARE-associated domain
VLVFAEAALLIGFVLPAETAVVVGGVLASHGRGTINLGILMAVVIVCAIVGDSVGYGIGHHFGERILGLRILNSRRAP